MKTHRLALLLIALVAALLPGTALAAGGSGGSVFVPSSGTVEGRVPLSGMTVELLAAKPGAKAPARLGTVRSGRSGYFTLAYDGALSGDVKYLLATGPTHGYQIVAYLGLGAPTAAPQIGPPQRP